MMKKNLTIIIIAASLILVNVIVGLIFNFHPSLGEEKVLQISEIIFSSLFLFAFLSIIIILRIKRYLQVLKGILIYQVAGSVLYVICLGASVLNMTGSANSVLRIFLWWAWPTQSLGIIFSRISSLSLRECLGLGYLIFTFITALIISSLIKDIEWDRKQAYERIDS